jgi:hypothetical protein
MDKPVLAVYPVSKCSVLGALPCNKICGHPRAGRRKPSPADVAKAHRQKLEDSTLGTYDERADGAHNYFYEKFDGAVVFTVLG